MFPIARFFDLASKKIFGDGIDSLKGVWLALGHLEEINKWNQLSLWVEFLWGPAQQGRGNHQIAGNEQQESGHSAELAVRERWLTFAGLQYARGADVANVTSAV